MELCHTPDADAVPSADVERIIELRFKRLCDGFEVAFAQLPLQCQPVLDAMSSTSRFSPVVKPSRLRFLLWARTGDCPVAHRHHQPRRRSQLMPW